MKVLVTGASGFLGSEIVRQLVAAGHSVRVLVRKTSKLDGLAGLKIEKAVGDILDAKAVEAALEGADALIHTAGNVGARRRDKDAVYRTNVEGTRTVMEAAARRPGLRVIHTSSVVAVGGSRKPGVLLDETSPWEHIGGMGYHYIDSKRQAEVVALSIAREKNLDLVILNPGMILGPGDVYLSSTRYVLEYLKGANRWYTNGGTSFCDVRDVAAAHVAALTKGRRLERYILAGANASFREILTQLRAVSGGVRPLPGPLPFLWTAAVISEAIATVSTHRLEELNRPVLRLARRFMYMDASKAQRELGYVVRPLGEMLRDTVADHVARGLVPTKRAPALAAAAAA
jgi:dihydroflavonol-4-reductase